MHNKILHKNKFQNLNFNMRSNIYEFFESSYLAKVASKLSRKDRVHILKLRDVGIYSYLNIKFCDGNKIEGEERRSSDDSIILENMNTFWGHTGNYGSLLKSSFPNCYR